ncbi:threonine aldolase family protein [Paratissierella segnis]|jgi:threonine aldolase|uniref:Aminotransferase class V-fold PLP-dependent enzyme n=1 Tax=Paratissierella segnis TaxID=2763679 RepID=A0A926EUE5_9FIRM|nr:aminotransferase class V-fold PLP-dependent enzyme [Paratissierella segnis]MBC8587841.1 aminotransferase class V-fold PLP-dependent enzyme [Paratissierella segnis]
MYSFRNDYSEGAHPRILELLNKYNLEANIGYGEDIHSDRARKYIKKLIGKDNVDIHFIPGGTQTNMLVISSFLRPHQCVIAADTGHINVHETGAIEATGHKVVAMHCKDGKLTPEIIQRALDRHTDEHMVQPKMVYISNSTELGTVYSKHELSAINDKCKENGLLLFLDGARLGSALTCKTNDLDIKDIANLVDVFYIGGTKNGALLGEALVIIREDLKEDFRYLTKQRGAMAAKGFILGIQFEALFLDDLYFELARHANEMAERLASIIDEAGYKFYAEPCTNQVFAIFPDVLLEKMGKEFIYEFTDKVDENNTAVRFVTSWATKIEAVEALREFLNKNR